MGVKIIRGLEMPKLRNDGMKKVIDLMQVGDAVKAESKYQATYIRKLMLQNGFTASQRTISNDVYVWRTG